VTAFRMVNQILELKNGVCYDKLGWWLRFISFFVCL